MGLSCASVAFVWVRDGHWGRLLKVMTAGVILGISANQAWAEDQAGGGGYVPRMGEPIDESKTFYPTEISRDWFLELNPLPLFDRTLVVEAERRLSSSFTLGLDVRYRSAEVYDSEGTSGTFSYLGIAPKVRFYPLPSLSGVFFGFKILAGSAEAEISSGPDSKSWSQWTVAPIAHVGYRINFLSGVTLALYLGGGVNIPALDVDDSEFPNAVQTGDDARRRRWRSAADKLNQQEGRFKPDIGLTIGASF